MNLYGVYEPQLDNLSEIGIRANVFLGIASGSATAAISCFIAAVTSSGWEIGILICAAIFFLIITAAFGLLTRNELLSKQKILNIIKQTKLES